MRKAPQIGFANLTEVKNNEMLPTVVAIVRGPQYLEFCFTRFVLTGKPILQTLPVRKS
jgi:hypothetical protein